ncbi:MAG: hypothetical protein ACHP7J_00065 [Terriglobales bacterium]
MAVQKCSCPDAKTLDAGEPTTCELCGGWRLAASQTISEKMMTLVYRLREIACGNVTVENEPIRSEDGATVIAVRHTITAEVLDPASAAPLPTYGKGQVAEMIEDGGFERWKHLHERITALEKDNAALRQAIDEKCYIVTDGAILVIPHTVTQIGYLVVKDGGTVKTAEFSGHEEAQRKLENKEAWERFLAASLPKQSSICKCPGATIPHVVGQYVYQCRCGGWRACCVESDNSIRSPEAAWGADGPVFGPLHVGHTKIVGAVAAVLQEAFPDVPVKALAIDPVPNHGPCAVCGLDVNHVFPWWTSNPEKPGAKPCHEECYKKVQFESLGLPPELVADQKTPTSCTCESLIDGHVPTCPLFKE